MDVETLEQVITSALSQSPEADEFTRVRISEAARQLSMRSETPWDRVGRLIWRESPVVAAVKIASDLHLFQTLAHGKLSLEHLSQATSATPGFLERLLALLSVGEFVQRSSDGTFELTEYGLALAQDVSLGHAVDYAYDALLPLAIHGPSFFQQNGYAEAPGGQVWQSATGNDVPFYAWLKQKPEKLSMFHSVMKGHASQRPTWLSVFPVETLLQGAEPGKPVCVDIAGSMGHDLKRFISQAKHLIQGPCFLHDLPEIVLHSQKECDGWDITVQEHDFFKPQPVHGAHIYYVHSTLLNWPDEQVVKILQNVKSAMKEGYSRLIINELVLDIHPGCPTLDYSMMGLFGGKVRTVQQWTSLISQAELRLVKLWTRPELAEGVFETSL